MMQDPERGLERAAKRLWSLSPNGLTVIASPEGAWQSPTFREIASSYDSSQ